MQVAPIGTMTVGLVLETVAVVEGRKHPSSPHLLATYRLVTAEGSWGGLGTWEGGLDFEELGLEDLG